ncbi:hypothetical protein CYFUS_006445 [Cystobacter fuscus]|uniref:DoxX family protein n=1 Tax=Cystobacter fuscus TaxID=43 RepID=A0A250JBN2_9BACT|nr:DoxX family membrane protein [Cystobacter fuscus]ATB40983.1 hypothetical protein CYFUS_006445 [Cystobacter fuscus]
MPPEPSTPFFRTLSCEGAAYFLLRLALGLNIFLHGAVRLPALGAFADTLVQGFAQTPLPSPLVRAFALLLPFLEAGLGLLLTLGLLTRAALFGGGLLMVVLVFGTALRSQWETLGLQMGYVFLYAVLLVTVRFNALALDGGWNVRKR